MSTTIVAALDVAARAHMLNRELQRAWRRAEAIEARQNDDDDDSDDIAQGSAKLSLEDRGRCVYVQWKPAKEMLASGPGERVCFF